MTLTRRLTAAAAAAFLLSVSVTPAVAQTPPPAPPAETATTPAPATPAPVPADAGATPAPAPVDAAATPAPAAADPGIDPATGLPLQPAAGPATKEEVLENPYGLRAMWEHGDYVSKGTLFILVIMSMGTWYILITKLIEQGRLMAQARQAERDFWSAASIHEGLGRLKETSAFRGIVEDGVRAAEHHEGTLLEQIDLNTWVTMTLQRSVDAVNSRLQGGLAFLATVGSTAPFVGLFGTVWGIYNALVAIGVSAQASIDKVAGPVGEALIMTAIGLGVAVPAVLAYNWLSRRNKAALERLRAFASDLHSVLLSGGSKGADKTRTATATVARSA